MSHLETEQSHVEIGFFYPTSPNSSMYVLYPAVVGGIP